MGINSWPISNPGIFECSDSTRLPLHAHGCLISELTACRHLIAMLWSGDVWRDGLRWGTRSQPSCVYGMCSLTCNRNGVAASLHSYPVDACALMTLAFEATSGEGKPTQRHRSALGDRALGAAADEDRGVRSPSKPVFMRPVTPPSRTWYGCGSCDIAHRCNVMGRRLASSLWLATPTTQLGGGAPNKEVIGL